MDASQLINKEQKFSLVSSPQKNLIRSGYLEKFKIGSKTKTSDSTNDQQKKIRVSNIILENIKNRSRSNEHKANTSKDTNQTELYENDDYWIKPGLIKFIKANVLSLYIIYSLHYVPASILIMKSQEILSTLMTTEYLQLWLEYCKINYIFLNNFLDLMISIYNCFNLIETINI